MKRLILPLLIFCGTLLPASRAEAHVALHHPVGQETFAPGLQVTIEWEVIIPHNQIDWDLYLSTDGGTTWEVLAEGLPLEQLTYVWTVPDLNTDAAQIRIVQDNTDVDYEDRSGNFTIGDRLTTVETPDDTLPQAISLFTSYPNPFTDATTLEFTLARPATVTLEVFNLLGERVAELANATLPAGTHRIAWNIDGEPSGVYLVRIQSGTHIETRKVLRME